MYLMISNTILSLQFNGRFIPNFKSTDEFQSSRKSLLPTNSENREHLKISGMLIVYWPITKKFRIYASKPQTNYLCCLRFYYFVISRIIGQFLATQHSINISGAHGFVSFTVKGREVNHFTISDVFTERRTVRSSNMYTLGPNEMELDLLFFLPQMSKYLSLGARPPFGVMQINPCFSLPRRRSLIPVNTVCEAAPRSLSLSPIGLNELPKVSFGFRCNLIGKSTIGFFFSGQT